MVVAGNQQEALAGAALPDSLAVKVTDAEGDPIPGQEVAFTLEKELPGADVAPGGGNGGGDGGEDGGHGGGHGHDGGHGHNGGHRGEDHD